MTEKVGGDRPDTSSNEVHGGGQIMPAPIWTRYAVYQLLQGGQEVGWVHVRGMVAGTVEVWQLYKTTVTGTNPNTGSLRAAYTWPSTRSYQGGGIIEKKRATTEIVYTTEIATSDLSDTGGAGAGNYRQVETSCQDQGL
ncbi:MAG: hypothetical protein HOO96_24735 [Polyangiaceae bacterium]|nr:hypothetical protein [Polyangiaceae bacterium]